MNAFFAQFLNKSHILGLFLTGVIGLTIGLGVYTAQYAEGASYLSNNPETCANCHVMREHFSAWQHSSHARVATCNDCHTPHDFFGKWLVKGINGFNHSLAFTTGNFHEPIRITEFNANVLQGSCLYCHEDYVHNILTAYPEEPVNCTSCHRDVGHRTRD